MHVEISFAEMFGLLVVLISAAWGLLKLTAHQFSKGLDERFQTMHNLFTLRADEQDKKLTHIDDMATKVQVLELEGYKRHAQNLELFCTKNELTAVSTKQDRTLEGIFSLLRAIDEKLSNKVSREECRVCRGESQ